MAVVVALIIGCDFSPPGGHRPTDLLHYISLIQLLRLNPDYNTMELIVLRGGLERFSLAFVLLMMILT